MFSALLIVAFIAGLAVAAGHSVHHLSQELERQPVACPAALAWGAASGADCPPSAESLVPLWASSLLSADPLFQPRNVPAGVRLGRAPPPASTR